MKTAVILIIAANLARGACIALPSDKILARDLSVAVPLFQTLDPETIVGFSPFPGSERVFTSTDLELAARGHGLTLPAGAPSVCVQREVHTLTIEEVTQALLTAIDNPAWHLEVLEFSNKPVPLGRLVFSLAGLNKPSGMGPPSAVIWPGGLVYDGQRSLSVWAKVRIFVDSEIFVAKDAIAKGVVIQAEQIVTTRRPEFPSLKSAPFSASSIVGKVARRAIPAGQRIAAEMLEDPKDVSQGETVRLKVVAGAATITLDAVAQSSGRKGETIVVHNPSSGKSFRARIEDRGRVIVVPAPGSTL